MGDSSYLLGTHTEELDRLRFQHELWLPAARAAWQRAGLAPGMRVLDVGAGQGAAGEAQALGSVGRLDDGVALPLEDAGDAPADQGVVVHGQDAGGGAWHSGPPVGVPPRAGGARG
jgi:hypothetical protein